MNLLIFAPEKQSRIRELTETFSLNSVLTINPPKLIFAPLPAKQTHQFIENNILDYVPDSIIIELSPSFDYGCLNILFKTLRDKFPVSLPYVYLISQAELFFNQLGYLLKDAVFYISESEHIPLENTGITDELFYFNSSRAFFKNKKPALLNLFKKISPEVPDNPALLQTDPKFWQYYKIVFNNNFYFHHIEISDAEIKNNSVRDVFQTKLSDPLIQIALSETFFEKIEPDYSPRSNFLPVQVCANPGIFELCQKIIPNTGIAEQIVFADKKNQYDCPDVFDIIGINPDASIFRFFDDTKDIKLSPNEIQSIYDCEKFPETIGSESETESLRFQYMSLLQKQRELENNGREKLFSKELIFQETEMIAKATEAYNLLNGIYRNMKIYGKKDTKKYKKMPGTVLVVGYDMESLRDVVHDIEKSKDFTFLNMSEFTDWESLTALAKTSYELYFDKPVLTTQDSYQKMRMDLNRFSKEIETAQQNLDNKIRKRTGKNISNELKKIEIEISQCLIKMFSSCLNRFLSANAEKVKTHNSIFTEKKRFERLKDISLPGLIISGSKYLTHCLEGSLNSVLSNFGGVGQFNFFDGNIQVQSKQKEQENTKEVFKEIIRNKLKRIGPALSLRYLIIQDDIHIIKLILEVLQNRTDPFLPVISLVEGIIDIEDVRFFKQNQYPVIYSGCYLLENPNLFEEKLSRAFNSYIPLVS